jgi:bacterial surface protein 26-residue repeat
MRYQSAILLMGLTLGGLFVGTTVAVAPAIPAQAAAATTTLQGTIGEGVHWTLKDADSVGYELHLNGGTLPDNPVDLDELVKPGQNVWDTDNPWINDIFKQSNVSHQAIVKIVFDGPVKTGRNAQFLFGGLRSLKAIEHLDRLNTSQATTMAGMFYMDESLDNAADNHELDVSHFDTANVTDMSYMFDGLHQLYQIDVAGFDTRQVTTMNHMFAATDGLQSLDVGHFQTGRVTDMGDMFSGCGYLNDDIKLNVASFDTRQVTNMAGMFSAIGAKNLTLTFDTSRVRDMSRMFWRAKNLTSLDVSHLDTSQVTNMAKMFSGLTLTSLPLDTLNTARVTNMYRMFADDTQLTTLTLPNFQTENVTDMGGMFSGDTALTDLDIAVFGRGRSSTWPRCSSKTSRSPAWT